MSKATMPTREEIAILESGACFMDQGEHYEAMRNMLLRIADALADSVVVPRAPTQAMWDAAQKRVSANRIVNDWGVIQRDPLAHAFLGFLDAAAKGEENG